MYFAATVTFCNHFTITMLFLRCFVPVLLALLVASQDPDSDLERFQDHLRIFRDVLGVRNETRLAMLRKMLEETHSTTEVPIDVSGGSETTSEMIFSILPIGPMPPPAVPTKTEPLTVTVTSVVTPNPIESTALEEIFKSLLQQHLKTYIQPSPAESRETTLWVEPSKTFENEAAPTQPATPSEPVLIPTDSLDDTKPPSDQLPKGGTKKQLANIKHENKIQVLPQFRHHKIGQAIKGGIYGKPKVAWFGNYATKPEAAVSLPAPETSSVTSFLTEFPEVDTIIEEAPHAEVEEAQGDEEWDYEPEGSSITEAPVPQMTSTAELPLTTASPSSRRSASNAPTKPTTLSSIPKINKSNKTRNPADSVLYATVAPQTPEKLQSTWERRRKTRTAHIYDVFSNTAVAQPSYSLTLGILVFAFFMVFL